MFSDNEDSGITSVFTYECAVWILIVNSSEKDARHEGIASTRGEFLRKQGLPPELSVPTHKTTRSGTK